MGSVRKIPNGVAFDEEGYLVDPTDWTEDLAVVLAERQDIHMTEAHWEIIRFMREWYQIHGVAPSPRDMGIFLKEHGWPRKEITRLFPYGYVQQACRVAGMQRPRAWSSG